MIYVIACISSFLSGLGVGGGSLFVLLSLIQNNLNLNEIRAYNLLMFVAIGVVFVFKNKSEIQKNIKSIITIIVFVTIGAIIGAKIGNKFSEKYLKIVFNTFMLLIGIYEIIVSVISIKKDKNINKKGDN